VKKNQNRGNTSHTQNKNVRRSEEGGKATILDRKNRALSKHGGTPCPWKKNHAASEEWAGKAKPHKPAERKKSEGWKGNGRKNSPKGTARSSINEKDWKYPRPEGGETTIRERDKTHGAIV